MGPAVHTRSSANVESRQESDLAINIRKATSIEETAPKRTCAVDVYERSSH